MIAIARVPGAGHRARERRPASSGTHVHPTAYCYAGDADPQAPGGMATIYRDLAADDDRNRQVAADVAVALARGRHCLVLTQWTRHLEELAGACP